MEVTEVTENSVTVTMPVNSKVHQPFGVLHGGALAALAENVASLAGNLLVEKTKMCVGLSLHSNHLRSVKTGMVLATAMPIHVGRGTQVWEINCHSDQGELINVSRMTLSVIDRK